MRRTMLVAVGLALGCSTDPARESEDRTDPPPAPVCGGTVDAERFGQLFSSLALLDLDTGHLGYPDGEHGVQFSRKVRLGLAGHALAPVRVYVCVPSFTTGTLAYGRFHDLGTGSFEIELVFFPQDRYTLHVMADQAPVRSFLFSTH